MSLEYRKSPLFAAGIIFRRTHSGALEFLLVEDQCRIKFPGGKAKQVEDCHWEGPETVLRRELEEEIRIIPKEFVLVKFYRLEDNHLKYFYLVTEHNESYNISDDGVLPILWLTKEEVLDSIVFSHLEAFKKALELIPRLPVRERAVA
jgi:8-oxo-dGTP pyrophosphatase MutT (NUDIX family)